MNDDERYFWKDRQRENSKMKEEIVTDELTYRVVRVNGSKRTVISFGLCKHDAELVANLWSKKFLPSGEVIVEQDVEIAT